VYRAINYGGKRRKNYYEEEFTVTERIVSYLRRWKVIKVENYRRIYAFSRTFFDVLLKNFQPPRSRVCVCAFKDLTMQNDSFSLWQNEHRKKSNPYLFLSLETCNINKECMYMARRRQ
jgi:hypothetical protein